MSCAYKCHALGRAPARIAATKKPVGAAPPLKSASDPPSTTKGAAVSDLADNPLLQSWETPFGLPPFDRIRPEHFPPAFDRAMIEHAAEIAAIASRPKPADFANTIEALERGGRTLTRIGRVFDNLTSSATNPALGAIDRDYAPRLAAHHTRLMLNPALFARIDALYRARDTLGLAADQE